MSENPLVSLLDEVRGKTFRVLNGLTAEQARWTPPGLRNTILWHAGHSFIVVEWLTMGAIGRPPQAPEGWFEIFSWESRPDLVPADRWPTLEEVVERLRDQQSRMREIYHELTPEVLARASASGSPRTVQSSIIHGLHDEACHCGEMMLLRKLQGLRRLTD